MNEKFTLAQFNIRSLIPKFNDLKEHILSVGYSILCLTETWISPAVSDDLIKIEGYNLVRRDRRIGRGGGVGMYIKENIHYSVIISDNDSEQLWVKFKVNKQQFAVGVTYRPPDFSYNDFIVKLEQNLTYLLPHYDEIFCLGDLNIDMLSTSQASIKLNTLFDTYNLVQIVDSPTRFTLTSATLIDLIITTNNNIVENVNVLSLNQMSDHELIYCKLNITHKKLNPIYKTIRDFKYFKEDQFYADLMSIPFENIYDINDIDAKVHFLNENILYLFNMHAPIKTIKITKKYAPWITENIRFLMSLRDKACNKWRRTKNEAHHSYYKMLKNYTTLVCRNEKKAYFEHRMRVDGINKIWKDMSLLNIAKREKSIPDELKNVNDLNDYFINCIPKLPADHDTVDYYKNNIKPNVDPFNFRPTSEYNVQKILYGIKSNAQGYDGLNIKLLLMCCPLILPFITHIINFSLENCIFPNSWKQALVQPLPKKTHPEEFKDLRPISILPTLSKVLEREVECQLRDHLTHFHLLPETQSGFRPMHSCETALLNITDDILRGSDQKKVTVLVLVDFTKAFDTINHEILFAVLGSMGLSAGAVNFFRSYLKNRTQRVKIDNSVSAPLQVSSGVPQGSILGPLLYTLYTSDFEKTAEHCQMHFYADDTQLYLSFDPEKCAEAMVAINKDLNSLVDKSRNHALNVNASKTSALVFGHHNSRSIMMENMAINVDGQQIAFTDKAKNLGVIFDTNLRFKSHINNCIRTAYTNLKMIYNIRHFLNQKIKTILCESLVLSRFNFADTVYGPCLDAEDTRRIQVLQNSCLRLIFGVKRRQSISHKLIQISWLNMSKRRLLHSACLFHKIINSEIPKYLNKKISHRTDVHNLNIRFKGTLTPPLHRTELFKRSFTYQITKIYNSIPSYIKNKTLPAFKFTFKKYLLSQQNNEP